MTTLSQLQRNYENNKKQGQRRTQLIRAEIQQSIQLETIRALKLQNHKVNQIHKNQQAIENKFKKQQQLLIELRSNQQIWQKMCDNLNRALMQAGDLVHYAGYVEAEVKQILGEGTVAQYLEEAERQDNQQTQTETVPLEQKVNQMETVAQLGTDVLENDVKKQQQAGSAN